MNFDDTIVAGRRCGTFSAFLGALLMGALAGCVSSAPKSPTMSLSAPDVPITPAQSAVKAAPNPRGTHLKDVQYTVYTGSALATLVDDIKAGRRKDVVIIGLTPKGYQNLSSNVVELERYIREQKTVIAYLRKVGGPRTTAKN